MRSLQRRDVEGATQPRELGHLDLFKVVAAQLIVLHHLAFYGPMSDHVQPWAPAAIGWLNDHARIAVQVFLVIGGFLAARSLSRTEQWSLTRLLGTIFDRYLKLAMPFCAALIVALAVYAGTRIWLTHESVPAPPGVSQFASHALLLQSVLDYESLLPGAWYVAIDFQLFVLMSVLAWFAYSHKGRLHKGWLLTTLVIVGVNLSLFWFNRDPAWDCWGIYFFGSYGLGALAWWAGSATDGRRTNWLLATAVVVSGVGALLVEFRSRIALALVVACLLIVLSRAKEPRSITGWRPLSNLARISYAVFLIHFPVCLIVNTLFVRLVPLDPRLQAGGMVIAWIASLAAGAAFYKWVELPLSQVFRAHGRHAWPRFSSHAVESPFVGELVMQRSDGRLNDGPTELERPPQRVSRLGPGMFPLVHSRFP